jgi:hypothetical protein
VGIEERLQQLEAANPDLCEQRSCQEPVAMTQKRLMPDGTVEVSGEPLTAALRCLPGARQPQSADPPHRGPARFPPGRRHLGGGHRRKRRSRGRRQS